MGRALDALMARESAAPTEPVSAVPASSEFSKGLRSGMSSATGQLNSLAGLAGEVVGADDFARERYAAAAQNQAQAQAPENAARVSSFRDIGGLRDAFDYGSGMLAQSAPVLGASLATIAATRGKVNPLVAGTLGATPFTAGGVVEQQQADPVAAAQPIAARASSALGTGLGQAALMNAVPVAMGGKLFAPAIGEAAGGMGLRVARNVGEAVVGNAAAGVGSEALGQSAATSMNPNRDTSQDNERMLEAGVGGAVVGLPFAGLGIAGDTMRARTPRQRAPGQAIEGAPPAVEAPVAEGPAPVPGAEAPAQRSIAERARELFQPVDRTPQRIAEGAETFDPTTMRDATPERQAQILSESDAARTEQVSGWAQRLMEGGKLDEAQRAQLAEAATDFTDRGKQAVVAGLKVAQEAGEKAVNAVGEFASAMKDRYPDQKPADGVKLSAIPAGADAAITEVIAPSLAASHPELVKNPTAMKAMASSMRRVVDGVQRTGEIDGDTAKQLRSWFGGDAPAVMADLQQRVMPDAKPDVTERYYSALRDLGTKLKAETSLEDMVSKSLSKDVQATPDDIRSTVAFLRDYANEQQPANKSKAQIDFDNQRIEGELRKHFGDKTETVLKAFRKEALDNQPDLVRAPPDGSASKSAQEEGGFADNGSSDGLTEGMTERQFFGGGNDKAKPEFMLAEQVHRQTYNSEAQAARVLRKAQSENPDQNVSVISARQYAKENGMPTAELMERTNGKPGDYVMVKSEGMKREGMTWNDIDAVKLDTNKYSKSTSRINTEEGTILDGVKLMKMFGDPKKLPFTDADAANPMYRLRRQMVEAIASVSDHLGEALNVPDKTVVAQRGGKDVTWKEVQEQGRGKTTDEKDMQREATFKNREAAEKALRDPNTTEGQKKTAREEIAMFDSALDRQTMRGNDPADVLADTPGARPDAVRTRDAAAEARKSVNALAKQLGDARKMIQEEAARVGPRGDSHVELRRQVTEMGDMVERMRSDGADAATLKHWEQREQALREVADKVGTDGRRPLTPKERGAMKDYLAAEKKMDASQTRLEAGRMTEREADMEARSMREAPLDRNVHEAEAAYGDKLGDRFAASEKQDADGNPMHAKNFADRNADGSLPATVRGAIQSKISALENMKADNGEKNKIAWNVGQKARDLFGKIDAMKVQDQAMLASIGKDRSISSIAGTINELYAKYKDVTPAKKDNAFTERVLGKGDLAPVIDSIKKSDDARNLQRVVDSLAEHAPTNERAARVLDATNERLGKIMERDTDGSTAYNMQRADPANTNSSKVKTDVRAHIDTVLGKTVDTEFAKMLHEGEFVTDKGRVPQGMAEDVIRISVHSLDPMSTAYHESMHGFMKKLRSDKLIDGAAPLFKAADSFRVKEQLERLLTNEPEALQQVRSNLEERAAYMYQFWAAGKLDLPTKPTTVLGKMAEFFRKVLGTWSNDQRAVNIMEYFQSGEYGKNMANRSAVASALAEGTNSRLETFKGMAAPLARLGSIVASTGDARMRSTLIPALGEIADNVYRPLHEKGNDPGYVPASRVKRGEFINELATSLRDMDPAVLTDALNSMQRGEKGGSTAERVAVRTVRQSLDKVFDYMKDAGVKVNDLGYGKDYFPRVWDASTVLSREKEFRAMMKKYEDSGQFTGSVDKVIAKLARADGSDLQIETIKPGMVNTKERILGFIEAKDAEPFLEKDMYRTLNGYITQATRRAEWARRFGDDGERLHAMFDQAAKEGASAKDLAMAADYLQGVDGTLGDSINPKLRRAFGNMIVYQNIRVLPLALFSSLIDPLGIAVRGGTAGEAFGAFKRGIMEIPKGFKEGAKHDSMTELAAQMGVIDSAVLMHTIGSTYSQGMVSDTGRRINNTFFKYNLMEQYNTSMRVAGTESAINFLGRHADGKFNQHSTRWLAELGMQPNEVIVKNGRPLLSASEFEAHGYSPDRAQGAADKMSLAVNKWVDGAVLRPNAAHKPIWMNDPHYALVSHLKQFVYSFQETILKRVANEAQHGNFGPAYSLASYVPFMMAADLMKGFIVGGGAQPGYKDSWDFGDYLWSGLQRAGLFGIGQFGIDVAKGIHRGDSGVGALTGPTIEQLGDAASVVAGPQQFKTFAMNALPANQLFDAATEATEATSTNTID